MNEDLRIFAGNSNRPLATEICRHLGLPLSPLEMSRFSNDNLHVQIQENVRERDVFVVQSFTEPVSDHIIELLITLDALRSASARRVTAVIPYYSYARSDKKDAPRISITGRLVADMLRTAGADRVLTMDLHADQVHGFFSVPVDHLTVIPTLVKHFKAHLDTSRDGGGSDGRRRRQAGRALLRAARHPHGDHRQAPRQRLRRQAWARRGRRARPRRGHHRRRDLHRRHAVATIRALRDAGARSVHAGATHGVFCGPAVARLREAEIETVVVTDTVLVPPEKQIGKIIMLPWLRCSRPRSVGFTRAGASGNCSSSGGTHRANVRACPARPGPVIDRARASIRHSRRVVTRMVVGDSVLRHNK